MSIRISARGFLSGATNAGARGWSAGLRPGGSGAGPGTAAGPEAGAPVAVSRYDRARDSGTDGSPVRSQRETHERDAAVRSCVCQKKAVDLRGHSALARLRRWMRRGQRGALPVNPARCGVPVRVERTEPLLGVLTCSVMPLDPARASRRDAPTPVARRRVR